MTTLIWKYKLHLSELYNSWVSKYYKNTILSTLVKKSYSKYKLDKVKISLWIFRMYSKILQEESCYTLISQFL